jgi:hypothetical protein
MVGKDDFFDTSMETSNTDLTMGAEAISITGQMEDID